MTPAHRTTRLLGGGAVLALVISVGVVMAQSQAVNALATATLTAKNVAPTSTAADPLSPGDTVTYSINYDCSSALPSDDCFDAVVTDVLPTFTDIDGATQQLEFVSASGTDDWTTLGVSGAEPNQVVTWNAVAGDCSGGTNTGLCPGDSGTLLLQLRVPEGIVPSTVDAQLVTNQAEIDLNGVVDASDAGPACAPVTPDTAADPCGSFINAESEASAISKSGPSTALLNAAGTDPIRYEIKICAEPLSPLYTTYTVTDTLPPGATVVGSLPFGGTQTDPGTPSTVTEAGDPPVETVTPGTGPTLVWNLDATNRPDIDADGCMTIPFDVEYENAAAGGDATNTIGEAKTNSVVAEGSSGGAPVDIGPATTTLTLDGPVTRFSPSKSTGGNYYVQNGDTVTYTLGARNSSDAEADPFTSATLTDGPLPTFVGGGFTLTQINTGTWTGAVSTVTASIEISTDGTNWTPVGGAPNTPIVGLPAGVTHVRWIFTSTDTGAPAIGPGWSATGQQLIGTVTGTDTPSQVRSNCVSLTGVQNGIDQSRGTRCANVELEQPQPHPSITKSAPGAIEPGQTITYTLVAGNDADATGPLVQPQISDCVPFSSHLVVGTISLGAGWTAEVGAPPVTACTAADGTSGTALQFQYAGTLNPGESAPAVTYQVTADSFQFPTVSDTPTPPGVYENTAVLTTAAGDAFAHCVQAGCEASHDVIVPVVAQLRSIKLVRGSLDNDFNIAGTTTAGSQADWKVEVLNVGNVPVDNVQYVDIFPHIGDTGVRRDDQNRGSEYRPLLIEPVTAPPGWTVEYSLSDNPCRPEVLGPSTGCDAPNWTTSPTLASLPSYGAVRLTYSGEIAIGDALEFAWQTAAPVFDPTYDTPNTTAGDYDALQSCSIPESTNPYPTGDPGNSMLQGSRTEESTWIDLNGDGIQQASEGGPTCPRASNSFAYGVDVPAASIPPGVPDPGRLGAEPAKVDLHVAAAPLTNSIGNLVFDDDDNDGIQDPGEDGIPFIRVDLLQAGVPIDTTFTDLNGNYSFDDLPDGDYSVRFYMPDSLGYISPQDQSGSPLDQAVTADNTDDDSDIPQVATGSTGGVGNYYDTTEVTLGNDPVSNESDPTWDAGIWIPRPSIDIEKYVNGLDADTLPGPNIPRGDAVTWTYDVTNTGNSYLKNVTVTDDVTFSSESDPTPVCDWGASSDAATPAGVLSRGETVSCTATGTAIRGRYSNRATVVGTPTLDDGVTSVVKTGVPTSVSDNDRAHYFGVEYDLALIKTASAATVAPDGSIIWTITVRNQGNVWSGAYTVTDVIPDGLTYTTASVTPTTSVGRVLTFDRPSLAAGATSAFTITTSVSDIGLRPFRNWAEISADSANALYSTTDYDSTPDSLVGDDDGAGTDFGDAPNDAVQDHDDPAFDSGTPAGFPGVDEDDNDYEDVDVSVEYDLALIKTADVGVVGEDGFVDWTVTVANQGNVASSDFEVTDRLPAGMTYVSATPAPTSNPSVGVYTWTIADLAPGATTTITIRTRADDLRLRPFRNWAEISADSASDYDVPGSTVTDVDSTPDANTGFDGAAGTGTAPNDAVQDHDDITFDSGTPTGFPGVDEDDNDYEDVDSDPVYDLALAKVADTPSVAFGEEPVWRARVYNQGNVSAGAVTVTDRLPTGLTLESAEVLASDATTVTGASCSAAGFIVTCSIPDIAVDDYVDVVITTSITDGDLSTAPWRNWAEISSDSAQSLYTVDDLDSIPDSETGRDDTLPTTDNYVGIATAGATYAGGAGFNDPAVDQDDNDDAVIVTSSFYDLALVKVVASQTIGYDADAEFSVTVENQGNLPSGAYTITDLVPDGLLPMALGGGTWDAVDRTITWTMPGLDPGETATVEYAAAISDITKRPFRNQAEISADSADTLYGIDDRDSTPDLDPDNDGTYPAVGATAGTDTDNLLISEAGTEGEEDDADIADVTALVVYDLALAKTVDATDLITEGPETGTADFTITVANQGSVPSHDFTITDDVPEGITPVLPLADGGVWDPTGRTITWNVTELLPGATTTRTFTVTITDITLQTFRNYAEISADSSDDYSTATETVVDVDSTPDLDTTNDGTYPPLGSAPGTGIDNIDVSGAGVDGGDPQDDADIADLTYDVTYDLALVKTADVAVMAYDDTVTFTVTVQNQGNVDSGAFTVTDIVPEGLTPVLPIPSDGLWNAATGTITWSLGTTDATELDAGATLTLDYSAVITDITQRPFRNYAEISADGADEYDSPFLDVEDDDSTPDADPDNDGLYPAEVEFPTPGDGIDNLVIAEAGTEPGDPQDDADIADVGVEVTYDLQLIKTSSGAPSAYDDVITYSLTVFNQGSVPSLGYSVVDQVPVGLRVVDAGDGVFDAVAGTITWDITDSIEPGASAVITFDVVIDDVNARPFVNVAEIAADSADAYDADDGVPLDVEDIDSVPDADLTDDEQTIDQTELQPGVDGFNDPSIDSDDHDIDRFDFDVVYDLALIKVADPAVIDPDGLVTFTITVENQGNVPANDFTVTDRVPAGLTLESNGGGTVAGESLTWQFDQLLPGETESVTFTMSIDDINARPFRNIAEISADSADDYDIDGNDVADVDSTPDDDPDNDGTYPVVGSTPGDGIDNLELTDAGLGADEDDADIADVTVNVVYDIAVVKVLPTGQRYRRGDIVTFQIRVENQGNVDSGAVTVADVVPAGLTPVSASDGGVISAGQVTWTIADLAPGETIVLTVGLRLDDITLAEYVNVAEITADSSSDYDTVSADDADDLDTVEISTADIRRDNPPVTVLPTSGSDAGAMPTIAALLVAIGVLLLSAGRRRRRT